MCSIKSFLFKQAMSVQGAAVLESEMKMGFAVSNHEAMQVGSEGISTRSRQQQNRDGRTNACCVIAPQLPYRLGSRCALCPTLPEWTPSGQPFLRHGSRTAVAVASEQDKPYELREVYLLDADDYLWVPDVLRFV